MYYRVQWAYAGGPGVVLAKGDVVDLTAAWAAAINADSPGVLLPAADGHAADDEPFDAAPSDRMLRKPGRKRAAA